MARPSKQSLFHPELASFGLVVREIRLEKSISQEALADLVGLDRSYMGGVERGEHNLALINIKRIANGLGLSIAQLMEKANL